jgi:hypothetical protein
MSRKSINRREFTSELAAAAATASTASFLAAAPSGLDAVADETNAKPAAEQEREPEPEPPKSQSDLLVEVVRQRYPDERLTPEILSKIRGDVQADQHRGKVLSDYPLKNSDEPAFIFAAYRGDADPPAAK